MPDRRASIEIVVILAVCAFLFFYGVGRFGLLGADEPRYAQIGVEMLARHDPIVPTLNNVPWLEKPPLLYWGEMAAYAVFGDHDWAARIPTSLLTSLMLLAIWAFVRRRIPERALDAALITASCIFVVGFGRGASTDMPLTACFTIAMLAWMEWFLSGRRAWLLAFYAFQALGMLAKGPVGPFLAGIIICVFALLWSPQTPAPESRESEAGSRMQVVLRTLWWPGILLFLAIAMPWYIAVQVKTGDFFRVFILEHNLARFGTNLYRHKQPFWYYLPVLLVGLLPWSSVFVAECVRTVRNLRAWRSERPLMLFVFLWCVIPVVFFSLSQSKLPGYILPAIPAAVLMVVHYLHERSDQRFPIPLLVMHALSCGALLALVLIAPNMLVKVKPGNLSVITSLVAGIATLVMVALTIYQRGLRVAARVTLVPVILAVFFVIQAASPVIDSTQSARPVARLLERFRGMQVFVYDVPRETEFGLPFYGFPVQSIDKSGLSTLPVHVIVISRTSDLHLRANLVRIGRFDPQKLFFYVTPARIPRTE